jgi:hypothetical protein
MVTGTMNFSNSGDQLEAFHRREHGDRRRDDAVAEQERRADDAEQDHDGNAGPIGDAVGGDQRQQRQDAALAVVVGAQHEHDVFERDHQHQRPEDQRHDAEDVGCQRLLVAGGAQCDGQGVERAGADVAEHHAERGERQEPELALVAGLAAVGWRPIEARRRRFGASGSIHSHGPLDYTRVGVVKIRIQVHSRQETALRRAGGVPGCRPSTSR